MLVGVLFALALTLTANPNALAANPTAPITVKWSTQALVSIKLFVNYATGYGQIPATIGAQPAPTHGPDANCPNGTPSPTCSVDFGNVVTGKNYVYRYAVHLNVVSTSATGVNVYGEGAADFTNTSGGTIPISSAVYWLNSTSGSPADANTGFSAATPFLLTSGMVTGGGSPGTVPSIAYTTYPAPISSSNVLDSDFYYDYQLKVPFTATSGLYYVWIVYTVLAK